MIRQPWNAFLDTPNSELEVFSVRFWRWETGRRTCLKELIYDSTLLRGRLTIRIRHHREIAAMVYKGAWDELDGQKIFRGFVPEDCTDLPRLM